MNSWVFVVPDRSGHPSGGTRYNAALIREIEARGVPVAALEPAAFELQGGALGDWVWVDSLYLDRVPSLAARARSLGKARVGLLLHYLPSRLEAGREQLWEVEAAALTACDAVAVTSEYMSALLAQTGFGSKPCAVIEPGCAFEMDRAPPEVSPLRALMVAHLVDNKGILDFLQALSRPLLRGDELRLEIAGSADVEPGYAQRCRELVERTPTLEQCVRFLGIVGGSELRRLYARSNAFVSASRTESYGMALAEARTMGLPLLAVQGGNVSAHVSSHSGGRLCSDIGELAQAVVQLSRSAEARASKLALARGAAPPPRPWARVAEEFLSRVQSLPWG